MKMRIYDLNFHNENLTLYHNSEEWVLHNGEKVVTWSSEAGSLLDLYGKEAGTQLYREIVTITEFGKGHVIEEERLPDEVRKLAEKFSD